MFLPLALVLVLAALWSGYWFVASGVAQDRLTAERARLATQGLTLACSEEGWGGYPFHFEFSCHSPVVTYAGKAEVRSANLLLVALAYAPWQVAALVDGPTTASTAGLSPITITHQRALAALTFDGSGRRSLSAEVPAIVAERLGRADKLMLFTRPTAAGGTEVAVELFNANYTPVGKPPVAIDEANLQGTLQQDQSFRLDKFEVKQGQLRYWGSGVLSLDQQHRVSGQVDTETNDIRALLAVAGPQLGLSDSQLANLRTMLGLLGNGAKAPVIARDGALFLGPFQVAELKPLY